MLFLEKRKWMKQIENILNLKYNRVKPKVGRVLLAGPFMQDYHFKNSVVLIIESNENGTLGVVLNKLYSMSINDLVADFPRINLPVFLGGPVNNDSLVFIHTLGDKLEGSLKIQEGLWFGGDFDQLIQLSRNHAVNSSSVRFFIGYTGWGVGQLNEELLRDDWLVSDISPKACFRICEDKELWNSMLSDLSGDYSYWEKLPDDPTLN